MGYKTLDKLGEQKIRDICSESRSYAEVAKKVGFSENSGSGKEYVKRYIDEHNIDISHFLGQGWNKNNYDLSVFRNGTAVNSDRAVKVLSYLRGRECEICHNKEWMGKPIPLCIHHIDGNHINNELTNLQLLCPNCHAMTDNYCGRNRGRKSKLKDSDFIKSLKTSKSIRQALISLGINYSAKYYYEKAYELMDKYDFSLGEDIK